MLEHQIQLPNWCKTQILPVSEQYGFWMNCQMESFWIGRVPFCTLSLFSTGKSVNAWIIPQSQISQWKHTIQFLIDAKHKICLFLNNVIGCNDNFTVICCGLAINFMQYMIRPYHTSYLGSSLISIAPWQGFLMNWSYSLNKLSLK